MKKTKSNNRTKFFLGVFLCLVLTIMVITLFGCGNKSSGNENEQGIDINADAILQYDKKEISLDTLESIKLDESITIENAVKRSDSYKSATFKAGVPTKPGNFWIRVTYPDKTFEVISVIVVDMSYRIEEIEVVYNQGTRYGYFSSFMNTSDIEFEVLCINGKDEVEGTATLDEDELDPAISTYHYTFTPTNTSLGNLHGEIDIEVYASIGFFMGENIIHSVEVPYNSFFEEYNIIEKPGYERPYWADINDVKYTSQTRVQNNVELFYHEDIKTFHMNYHLNGGENANNPDSYTIEKSNFALLDPSKENYRFIGWFTESNFAPESQIAYIEVSSLCDYDLYAKYEAIKTDPIIHINPLNLVYNGQPQALADITVEGGTLYYYYNGANNSTVQTKTDAGDYQVTFWVRGDEFHFDTEHQTIDVSIAKANYDLSTFTFEDKTVVYDGKSHTITITGTRPYGLQINYSGEGTNAGTYDITASFIVQSQNYEPVDDIVAVLTIEKADPVYTAPTNRVLTYNTMDQTLLNAGSTEDGLFVYSLDNNTWVDTIPTTTNAGNYNVYYKLVGDGNHKDVTGQLTTTIAKATYDMSNVIFADASKVYNRMIQGIEISDIDTLPNGVEVSYTGAAENVGEYTITASFTGDSTNYENIADMTAILTITKATLETTIPTAITGLVYSGEQQALIEEGTIDYGSVQYSLDGETYSSNVITAKNANSYKIYYRFVYDEANYVLDNQNGSLDVSIAKANITKVVVNGYTGKQNQVHSIVATTPEAMTVGDETITWLYSKNGNDNWVSDIQVSDTRESGVYYYKAIADNHNEITGSLVVSITLKEAATIIITNINALSKVYDGTAIVDPVISTDADNDGTQTITYSTDGSTFVSIKPQDANTYTIKVEIAECDNYAATTKTFVIEITKKTLSITGIVIASKTYDGNTSASISNAGSLSGIVDGESITLITTSAVATFKSANSGNSVEVTVQGYSISGETISNYSFATTWITTGTINKAPLTISAPKANVLSYTGSAQDLVVAGESESGAQITYNLNGGTYSTSIPKATNAGTYNVGYIFSINSINYDTQGVPTTGTIVVTVAKANVVSSSPTAKLLTYNTADQNLINAGLTDIGSIEYSLNSGTYSSIIPKAKTAGTYTVSYRFVVDRNNYDVVPDGSVQVTIAKATPSYTTPTNIKTIQGRTLSEVALPTGFVFQDAGSTSVGAVGNNTFKVKFTPTDTTNYAVVNNIDLIVHVFERYQLVIVCTDGQSNTYTASTQGPTITMKADDETITTGFTVSYQYKLTSASSYTSGLPTNAGTYNIKINANGYDYSDAVEKVVTYVINKATLTVTASTIQINYNSSARAWSNIQSTILAGITYTGLKGSDTTTFTVNGMHNGKYKYGTVSGSYIAPTSDVVIGNNYTNVIGSTYLALFTQSNANYTLSKDYVLVKYKTAMIGSTYYTIEDALTSSGTITFAGDQSGDATYVATMFSALDTSYTGYSSSYTLTGSRTLIVPYKNSADEYEYKEDDPNNNPISSRRVYSALIIPANITLNVTSSAKIAVGALIGYRQPNTTGVYDRGVVVNDGTINIASGCSYKSYGYTKGTGTINFASNSTALDVMATYDWPGGNTATKLENTLPLNAWTFHNISCVSIINHGAKYYAQLYAVASSTNIWKDVCIISSSSDDSPIFVSSSGYIRKYAIKAASWTESHESAKALKSITGSNQIAGQKDILELYGAFVDAALKISVSGFSIAASTSICAPMGYTDIYLRSGTNLTLSKADYLFLPGTKLVIDSGATLTTNAGVDLSFEKMANLNSSNYTQSNYAYIKRCVDQVDAYIEVNGTFICKGNIGGLIKTSGTGNLNLASATLTSTHRSLTNANGASATSDMNCAYIVEGLPAQGYINDTSAIYAFTKSTYTGNAAGYFTGTRGSANPGNGTLSETEPIGGTTCFAEGTMIAMADGTYKAVEDLQVGDMLIVFNHETGKYDVAPLLTNVHAFAEKKDVLVINLYFANGTHLRIVGEHGLFDLEAMEYVYINTENCRNFIGHRFVTYENVNGEMIASNTTLERVFVSCESIKVYNPASVWHLNLVAEGMLTLSAGMVNFFDYDDNLQYNAEQMAADIETYGLYEYADFADYVSEEVFNAFPFKYFKVAVGKGLFTYDKILWLIGFYNSSESNS